MSKTIMVIVTMAIAIDSNLVLMGCSQTAVEKRAAKPEFSERLKRDAITGEVTNVGSNYVAIQTNNGETTRVRVNDKTKIDNVIKGDKVKAYVTDDGYASTIQRLEP